MSSEGDAVHRQLSPSLAFILALVMCEASLREAFAGALTLDMLCLRLLIALVGSYAAIRLVNRIIAGYAGGLEASAPEQAPVEERAA